MPRLLSVIVIAVFIPAALLGQAQRSRKNKPIPASLQEYAQLRAMPEVIGKLSAVRTGKSNKTLTLHVPYMYAVSKSSRRAMPNPGHMPYSFSGTRQQSYQSQVVSLEQQYHKALKTKNAIQREQKLAAIMVKMHQLKARIAIANSQQQLKLELKLRQQMTAQANRVFGSLVRNSAYIALGNKEFEVDISKELIVRRQSPAEELDKNGLPLKLTKKELARLKGKDKTLPGYEATLQDLQSGQVIKAYLSQPRVEKKGGKETPARGKIIVPQDVGEKADEKKAGVVSAGLPKVRMVLILVEADE